MKPIHNFPSSFELSQVQSRTPENKVIVFFNCLCSTKTSSHLSGVFTDQKRQLGCNDNNSVRFLVRIYSFVGLLYALLFIICKFDIKFFACIFSEESEEEDELELTPVRRKKVK
jgi:hypothetical protein